MRSESRPILADESASASGGRLTAFRRWISPRRRPLHERGALACFLALWIAVAYLRFHGITLQTEQSGDGNEYFRAAIQWSKGNFRYLELTTGITFYRPASYILYGGAIRMLGERPYTLKLLNAGFDVANIGLMFAVGWVATGSPWVALAPPALYASMPVVHEFAHGRYAEYVHVHSEFFVLAAFLGYLVFRRVLGHPRGRPLAWLALSGFSFSVAANTHDDLLFILPPMLFFIATDAWRWASDAGGRGRLGLLARSVGVFGAAYALPFVLGMLVYSPAFILGYYGGMSRLQEEIAGEYLGPTTALFSTALGPLRIIINALGELSGKPAVNLHAFFFFVALPIALARLPARAARAGLGYHPFVLVIVYASALFAFQPNFPVGASRMFIPLLPFIFLGIVFWWRDLFTGWGPIGQAAALVGLLLLSLAWMPTTWPVRRSGASARREVPGASAGPLEGALFARDMDGRFLRLSSVQVMRPLYKVQGRVLDQGVEDLIRRKEVDYFYIRRAAPMSGADAWPIELYPLEFQRTDAPGLAVEMDRLRDYLSVHRGDAIYDNRTATIYPIETVAYDFTAQLRRARFEQGQGIHQVSVLNFNLGGRRTGIFAHPDRRIVFPAVSIRPFSTLLFAPYLRLTPHHWALTDGAVFAIVVRPEGGRREEVYRRSLNPAGEERDRSLAYERLSLARFAGQTLDIEFVTEKKANDSYDHCVWVDPLIVVWE